MNYYTSLIIMSEFIIALLIIVVFTNKNFNKRTRISLIITFLFVMIGAICEWICSTIQYGLLKEYSNTDFNVLLCRSLRLLQFSTVPVTPILFSKAIFETIPKGKFEKILFEILRAYMIAEELLLFIGYFYFSKTYNRYNEFIIYDLYVITFIICTIYLFINAFIFSKYYQNENKLQLCMMIIFITIGVSIQILNSSIKTCWITIAVASTFIYIYYDELIQCIDGLTLLLNQKSFDNHLQNINRKCIIIIFDVNDFKCINDTYGHNFWDTILKIISKVIKKNYQRHGKCYRIGGDEFAVILEKNLNNSDELNNRFIQFLEEERINLYEIPHISYGASEYDPSKKDIHNILDVRKEADKAMYRYKEYFKKNQNKIMWTIKSVR